MNNDSGFCTDYRTVTSIEPVKRGFFRVFLNDEPVMRLTGTDITALGLEPGMQISEDQFGRICSLILTKRARLRCMEILENRDKTESELRRQLKEEEYPDVVAEDALSYVKSYHYLDDSRYARMYIDAKKNVWSRTQIVMQLRQKGIEDHLIEEAWEEEGPADDSALIRKYAQKKGFDPHADDSRARQRFYQFLIRKGFRMNDIRKALDDNES